MDAAKEKVKTTSYINRTALRKYILAQAEKTGRRQFTRVGSSFLDRLESKLMNIVCSEIHSHPAKGKTLL